MKLIFRLKTSFPGKMKETTNRFLHPEKTRLLISNPDFDLWLHPYMDYFLIQFPVSANGH